MMPIKCTSINSQILNEASQCVESTNGVKEGRWKATLTFYKSIPVSSGKIPARFSGDFSSRTAGQVLFRNTGQRIFMEADSSIQNIMKLQSYKMRVAFKSEGFQNQLGEFQLRVGKVVPTHSEKLRGKVTEVEYLPIASIEKSRQIMEEFLDIRQEALSKRSLSDQFMHMNLILTEYGLPNPYTSQHSSSIWYCYGSTDCICAKWAGSEKLGSNH